MRLRLVAGDIIIILLFIAIGLGGIYLNAAGKGSPGAKYMHIYVDNQLVREISLVNSNEKSTVSFTFGNDNEYEAEVEIKNGRVRMLPLGKELCPRGICSHTGWISQPGETIVCLPNRIMIVFDTPQDNDSDVDGITY